MARRFHKWIAPVVLCAIVALAGCKQIVNARGDGEKLVADMHTAMSRGDWKGIYAAADPELRAGTPEDKFGALFTAISKNLGNPVSFSSKGWNLDRAADGTFLKAICQTQFSNNASGTETFEWRKVDGKYLLFSYHIKSDQLTTR